MTQSNILIIDDDEIVSRTVERCLRLENLNVSIANSGVEGLKTARRTLPDLVILDVIMPGMDGYSVCKEMRRDPILSDVPILFLTAKIKDEDKINGFRSGADDYLCKPFNLEEICLRVKAILRRSAKNDRFSGSINKTMEFIQQNPDENHKIKIAGYILNTRTYELITPDNTIIRLTPVQYDLLYHLMTHPGEIFSPTRLLDIIWDYPSDAGSPDLVRVHIKNLRTRVEANPHTPSFIRTVPGYGYTVGLNSHP